VSFIVSIFLYIIILHSNHFTYIREEIKGNFGLLTFSCFSPIITSLYAYRGRGFWLVLISLLLAIIPFGIFICLVLSRNCLNSLEPRVILSAAYGFICIYPCFIGLKIEKNGLLSDAFQLFKENLAFVSIGAIIFLFLFERICENVGTEYGSLIFFFDFLALAVSFTYIAFGYFSKNEYNLSPLAFFISSFLSFSIGFLFSALILEFWGKLGGTPDHWPFICVWTVFFANISLSLEKNPEIKMQAREALRWLTQKLD
jgi:hypothetical protein